MEIFKKPQSPMEFEGTYFYPLTTCDQIVLEDNSRLNELLEGIPYIGEEIQGSQIVPVNADTLGGKTEGMLSVANADNANMLNGKTIDALKSLIVNSIYPIGSIYTSVSSTNPSTLFGGTWEQLKDTFLLAAGDTYAAGSTGGEATHTLTVNEMPSHSHKIDGDINYGGVTSGSTHYVTNRTIQYNNNSTQSTGGSQPHNNMPPYTTVYVWKRTA